MAGVVRLWGAAVGEDIKSRQNTSARIGVRPRARRRTQPPPAWSHPPRAPHESTHTCNARTPQANAARRTASSRARSPPVASTRPAATRLAHPPLPSSPTGRDARPDPPLRPSTSYGPRGDTGNRGHAPVRAGSDRRRLGVSRMAGVFASPSTACFHTLDRARATTFGSCTASPASPAAPDPAAARCSPQVQQMAPQRLQSPVRHPARPLPRQPRIEAVPVDHAHHGEPNIRIRPLTWRRLRPELRPERRRPARS